MDPVTPNPTPTPSATPTPSPTPAASPLAGADGTLSANWLQHEKIPADLRTDKTLSTIKDVPTLATMLVNAERAIGKKRAVIPTDPQNKAEVDEFFGLAGWPKEGPDKYPQVALPDDMPKELATDPQQIEFRKAETAAWRAMAHKWHLTEEQFVGLSKDIAAHEVAGIKGAQADAVKLMNERRAAFRTKHGAKADFMVQLSNTAAAAFTDQEELAYATAQGWLQDPVFQSIMAKVGGAVSPDRLRANSSGGIDTGSIERQIADLETSDAYRNANNPKHDAVTQQVLQLREQLRAARQP